MASNESPEEEITESLPRDVRDDIEKIELDDISETLREEAVGSRGEKHDQRTASNIEVPGVSYSGDETAGDSLAGVAQGHYPQSQIVEEVHGNDSYNTAKNTGTYNQESSTSSAQHATIVGMTTGSVSGVRKVEQLSPRKQRPKLESEGNDGSTDDGMNGPEKNYHNMPEKQQQPAQLSDSYEKNSTQGLMNDGTRQSAHEGDLAYSPENATDQHIANSTTETPNSKKNSSAERSYEDSNMQSAKRHYYQNLGGRANKIILNTEKSSNSILHPEIYEDVLKINESKLGVADFERRIRFLKHAIESGRKPSLGKQALHNDPKLVAKELSSTASTRNFSSENRITLSSNGASPLSQLTPAKADLGCNYRAKSLGNARGHDKSATNSEVASSMRLRNLSIKIDHERHVYDRRQSEHQETIVYINRQRKVVKALKSIVENIAQAIENKEKNFLQQSQALAIPKKEKEDLYRVLAGLAHQRREMITKSQNVFLQLIRQDEQRQRMAPTMDFTRFNNNPNSKSLAGPTYKLKAAILTHSAAELEMQLLLPVLGSPIQPRSEEGTRYKDQGNSRTRGAYGTKKNIHKVQQTNSAHQHPQQPNDEAQSAATQTSTNGNHAWYHETSRRKNSILNQKLQSPQETQNGKVPVSALRIGNFKVASTIENYRNTEELNESSPKIGLLDCNRGAMRTDTSVSSVNQIDALLHRKPNPRSYGVEGYQASSANFSVDIHSNAQSTPRIKDARKKEACNADGIKIANLRRTAEVENSDRVSECAKKALFLALINIELRTKAANLKKKHLGLESFTQSLLRVTELPSIQAIVDSFQDIQEHIQSLIKYLNVLHGEICSIENGETEALKSKIPKETSKM